MSACDRPLVEHKFPPIYVELEGLTPNTCVGFDNALAYAIHQSESIEDPPPRANERCCSFFTKSTKQLRRVWGIIFRLSRIPYGDTDLVHKGMLNSLFRAITGGDAPLEAKNPEWMKLGFQDPTPAHDIRGGGILGLLLPLWLFEKCPSLGQRVIKIMYTGNERTQLMIVLINFAFVALETAGTSSLLSYGKTDEQSWMHFLAFFGGLTERFCAKVEAGEINIITEFDKVREIMDASKSRPKATVEEFLRSQIL